MYCSHVFPWARFYVFFWEHLSICFSRLTSTAMLVDDASGIYLMQNLYKFDTFSTSKFSIWKILCLLKSLGIEDLYIHKSMVSIPSCINKDLALAGVETNNSLCENTANNFLLNITMKQHPISFQYALLGTFISPTTALLSRLFSLFPFGGIC